MLQLKTYLRTTRKDKKSESVIYFIVANEWISTKLKLNTEYWDAASETITKKHPNYFTIAPVLQQLKARAEQCVSNYLFTGESFDRAYFETCVFQGVGYAENPCLVKFIKEYVATKNVDLPRAKHYFQLSNQICAVIARPKVRDITATFTDKFTKHLRIKKDNPNCENTISRKVKMLKALVHFAEQKGILKKDPLHSISVKAIKGTKQFLTYSEVEKLELYYNSELPESHKKLLQSFLFSCYTGLRYSDVKKLKYENIKNNAVETTQEKTDKPVLVPLSSYAKNLLEKNKTGKCFNIQQSQPANRLLKDIMEAAGIDKHISYHCSRHTFGTLSITFGIPIEVVAELMGVDFATVKIYAKIVSEVKQNEMLKWERKAI